MKRLLACGVLLVLAAVGVRAASDDSPKTSKEALQALNDFIGEWKGSGGPDKPKLGPRAPHLEGRPRMGLEIQG